jgi:predicted Zn-dependent protease
MTLLLAALLAAIGDTPLSASAAARFDHAVRLQQRGALAEAEAEYRALIADVPGHAESHANLGVVLARQGRYEEAVASYATALRLDPALTAARLNLGIAYYRAGQLEKASAALDEYLRLDPASVQARELLGLILVDMGRDAEGAGHLERSLPSDPDNAAALYALGRAYLRLHRPEEVSVASRLESLPAGRRLAHLLRGLSRLERGESRSALDELQAAAALDGELPELQVSLGIAYLRAGQRTEARASFERELARSASDARSLYYLAFLDHEEGRLDQARGRLDTLLSFDPGSGPGNALLGRILLQDGRALEASRALELAVARDPEDSTRHYLLARAYQALGRREDAAREFAQVQRLKDGELEAEKLRSPRPESPRDRPQ